MKLKGISTIEQHIEKIVLGVVGAALLGVVGTQLVGESKIQVGKEEVAIGDAFKPAERAARALLADINATEPKLPEAPSFGKLSEYGSMLQASVATGGRLPDLGVKTALAGGAGPSRGGDALYAALAVPAPTRAIAHGFRGTIDPWEKVSLPELAKLLPAEQPYDKAAVSVEAGFSGTSLREALTTDPDGEGPLLAIPSGWWRDGVEIIGVEVEREQLTSDGQWTAATLLGGLPGRLNLLDEWRAGVKGLADAASMVARAKDNAEEIQRPEYYRMIAGEEWAPPRVWQAREESGFDPIEVAAKQDRLAEVTADLEKLRAELAALPASDAPGNERRREQPPPSRGGEGGGGKGGAGGETPRQPSERAENPQAKRRELETRIRRLDAELKRLNEQLGAVGGGEDPAKAQLGQQPSGTGPRPRLVDSDEIRLWSHDLTVQSGETYRYRMRVVVNNPLFARAGLKQDDPSQAKLAESSTVTSAWSEWSKPAQVDQDAYWFIVGASRDALRQNLASARAECFRFYYGHYRRAEASLEPGDALIAEAKLPKLYLFDEAKLAAADGAGQPAPGGGRDDGGRGGKGAEGPDGPGARGNQTPAGAPDATDAPPNSTPAKDRIVFTDTRDVVLLDVSPATMAPAEREIFEALVRDADGRVVVRRPDADRQSAVYRRLSRSAELGEKQGQPKPQPKAPRPESPRERERPRDDVGKGGGGSGG